MVCKTTKKDYKYFDIRTDGCKQISSDSISVCKIAKNSNKIDSACKTADHFICKKIDIVEQYFSDVDSQQYMINIVKLSKNERRRF